MSQIITAFDSHDAIAKTIERNFLSYFVGFTCLPRMVLYQDDEVVWFAANSAPGNAILRANIRPERVSAKIEEIMAAMSAKDVGGAWWHIFPHSQPTDLAAQLLAAGWRPVGSEPAMLADLPTLNLNETPNLPANFRIVRVSDEATMRDWFVASVAGFGTTEQAGRPYYDAYACIGFNPAGAWQHYVGYLDNQPVTSSTLLLADGLAGIYDVSTIPTARHKGLGTAITLTPMRVARQLGYRYAMLFASDEGHPVYRRIGFTDQFIRQDYEWRRLAKPLLRQPL